MHPDLTKNSNFLKYYTKWQEDLTSLAFIPVAEYCLHYNLIKEAISICQEGIKHNPDSILAHLTLAKGYLKHTHLKKSSEHLRKVLALIPDHKQAKAMLEKIKALPYEKAEEAPPPKVAGWNTITMAKILASQGNRDRARQIYQHILTKDPNNSEAATALQSL